jgi:citrate lyase synthetase
VPRITLRGSPISASEVRRLLQNKSLQEIKEMVPETTMCQLINCFGDQRRETEMTDGDDH